MGERTSYAPGTFSWAELITSDADAAKAFYANVFGWTYDDQPVGEGQVYSMALRDGKTVGALAAGDDRPPHWNCYVSVENVDQSAARSGELGATLLAEPFDVMDAGRMAVIADPNGSVLQLWQAGRTIGAQLVNADGSLTWNDLITADVDKSLEFYGPLFGWTFQEIPESGGYRVIKNGERSNGGIMPRQGPQQPGWLPYFGHADVERLLEEIPGYGGAVLTGAMHLPNGTIAVVGDPQGAAFAVFTGDYDDD
jgi:predicted enzyme related to lactoylglutathione lyase